MKGDKQVKFVSGPLPKSRPPQGYYDDIVKQLKKKPGKTAEVNRVSRDGKSSSYVVPGYSALKRRGCDVTQARDGGDIVLFAVWPKSC